MNNLVIRHERREYQRSMTDTIFVSIGPDLPAVGVISQLVDFGIAEDPQKNMGPIDCLFSTPAEAITGKARPPRYLMAKELKAYAAAIEKVALILDEWELMGSIPTLLIQDISS